MVLTVLLQGGLLQTHEIGGRDPVQGAGTDAARGGSRDMVASGSSRVGRAPPLSALPLRQLGAFTQVLEGAASPLMPSL